MQAHGQFAGGLLVDLLDDSVQALDGGDRGNRVINVQVPLFGSDCRFVMVTRRPCGTICNTRPLSPAEEKRFLAAIGVL